MQHSDVPQRIAVHDDEVGELARLEGADAIRHPHQLGAAPGRARDGLERREADHVHEDLDVLGVLPVRIPGEAEVAARAHPDAEVPGAAIGVGGLLDLVAEPARPHDGLGDAEAGPVLDDRVEVAEPRDERQPLVRDHPERLVVGVGRVLERVHARLGGDAARALAAHVGGGHAASHPRLVHQGLDLGQRIGAVADGRVGQQGVPADVALDDVGAVLDGAAHRRADGVGPVRDEGEALHAEPQVGRVPVGHAAGGADVPARGEEARARVEALREGLLQRGVDAVHRARRARRRVAAVQRELAVLGGAKRGQLGRTVEVEIGDDLDVVVRKMDMRLDEAGDHRPSAEVQRLGLAGARGVRRREGTRVDDGVALDHEGGAFAGGRAGPVDEPEVLEMEAHGVLPLEGGQPGDHGADLVDRRGRGDEQRAKVGLAPGEVGGVLRHLDHAEVHRPRG